MSDWLMEGHLRVSEAAMVYAEPMQRQGRHWSNIYGSWMTERMSLWVAAPEVFSTCCWLNSSHWGFNMVMVAPQWLGQLPRDQVLDWYAPWNGGCWGSPSANQKHKWCLTGTGSPKDSGRAAIPGLDSQFVWGCQLILLWGIYNGSGVMGQEMK